MESNPLGGRRELTAVVAGLIAVSVLLGLLHLLYGSVKTEGVFWFNLDKERNLATWFSGVLFALLGVAAMLAYYQEHRANQEGASFPLPWLWLGVTAVGMFMSIDEITILHENLFWKEVRQASSQLGNEWKYITQWQVLYAPAILIVLAYMTIFFINRFSISRTARTVAFSGIGCWLGALVLEAFRQAIKFEGKSLYRLSALVEEELEMIGAILLIGSVLAYAQSIAAGAAAGSVRATSKFLTGRALASAGILVLVLGAVAFYVHRSAERLDREGSRVPSLMRKATGQENRND